MRKRLTVVALAAVATLSGCAVVVQVDDTRVRAQNDLVDLSVDVNGVTTNVDAIDLNTVWIGDVLFSSVDGGYETSAEITYSTGNVTVTIDEAVVWTPVLGVAVPVSFTDIEPMYTTIATGTTNTVVFDGTTAGVIFSALAKKRPK